MGAGGMPGEGLVSLVARLARAIRLQSGRRRAEKRWRRFERDLGIKRPLRDPPGAGQKYPHAITHDAILNREYAYSVIGRIIEENRHRGCYSANPRTGSIYDVENPAEAKSLYDELVDMNGFDKIKRIYLVSTTNHIGEWSRELHSAFLDLAGRELTPLIGKWKDTVINEKTGESIIHIYHDATYPTQMNKESLFAQARKEQQESVLYVTPEGDHKFEPVK